MHTIMAGYVERGEIPGAVTLVARRGDVHVDAVGSLALGGAAPMARDSIFRISSMTKPVTAVAAMILVEECKLRLDEPADDLLPELVNRRVLVRLESELDDTVPAKRAITLRDLLTSRMGFGIVMRAPGSTPIQRATDALALGQGAPNPMVCPPPDEWMRRFGTLPLMHQPGEQWMYNTSLDVLGVLIARASGMSLPDFLSERVFEPLGMFDTAFFVPKNKQHRFTTAYIPDPATGTLSLFDGPTDGQWSSPPSFPAGAAGLVSTVDDLLALGEMMLGHGARGAMRILSRPTVELMTNDHLTAEQKPPWGSQGSYFATHGWGFGMSVVTQTSDYFGTVGTFGWDGGLGTSWYCDPREGMVRILMTQAMWTSPAGTRVSADFATTVYQAVDD
ncbi:MAG: beta-lactamase family protein [Gemmatimonadaceae bacterium]|nr:beta-lactamase family protein [Gemmatimonadaceae bacterium]